MIIIIYFKNALWLFGLKSLQRFYSTCYLSFKFSDFDFSLYTIFFYVMFICIYLLQSSVHLLCTQSPQVFMYFSYIFLTVLFHHTTALSLLFIIFRFPIISLKILVITVRLSAVTSSDTFYYYFFLKNIFVYCLKFNKNPRI